MLNMAVSTAAVRALCTLVIPPGKCQVIEYEFAVPAIVVVAVKTTFCPGHAGSVISFKTMFTFSQESADK